MKVGVFTVLFSDKPLEETLNYVASCGVKAVELGTGNYPGNAHCSPDELLGSKAKQRALLKAVKSRGLEISALSCHGNPLHPDESIASEHHETHRKTVELAERLGVGVVVDFSGCPGGSPEDKRPNWVTCPWPPDYSELLEWQWKKVVIPYWRSEAKFAKEHSVKIAFEMHPGFVVYNPRTLLALKKACGRNGDVIGANFDPSHLFWQGIDPVAAIRELSGSIFHFHAKDCKVDPINSGKHGVLDTTTYADEINRTWIFRTVGYGHDYAVWKNIVSALRLVGYDGALSIEHEDSLMNTEEGFEKAVRFLKEVVIEKERPEIWWA